MRGSDRVVCFAGHSSVRFNSNSRNARIIRADGHSTAYVYTDAYALDCTLLTTDVNANTPANLCLNAHTHTCSYVNASPHFYACAHTHTFIYGSTNAHTHTCTSTGAHSNANSHTCSNSHPHSCPYTHANALGRIAGVRARANQQRPDGPWGRAGGFG